MSDSTKRKPAVRRERSKVCQTSLPAVTTITPKKPHRVMLHFITDMAVLMPQN